MPIRINLLAEAQAIEEQRRRDPVKRLILAGIVCVALLLAYSSSLFFNSVSANSQLARLERDCSSRTNENRQILESQRLLTEGKQKLDALHRLATNRFLVGTLLNTLQQFTNEHVQLVRIKLDQIYILTEEVKPKTPADRTAAKPATATEKTMLTINAKDTSGTPVGVFNEYQKEMSAMPYFQESMGKTNGFRLANLGTPQTTPSGKPFTLFALETSFPEKTR